MYMHVKRYVQRPALSLDTNEKGDKSCRDHKIIELIASTRKYECVIVLRGTLTRVLRHCPTI
jgi:hypothetical protein